jgi:hypothetical protein
MDEEPYFLIDGKRIAIIGSRDYGVWYDDEGRKHQDLSDVTEFIGSLPPCVTIVSGGARGVDTAAEQAAIEFGMSLKVWKADWATYGKRAGMVRNRQIVDDVDCVVAFWDGFSRGTANTIETARAKGKFTLVFNERG